MATGNPRTASVFTINLSVPGHRCAKPHDLEPHQRQTVNTSRINALQEPRPTAAREWLRHHELVSVNGACREGGTAAGSANGNWEAAAVTLAAGANALTVVARTVRAIRDRVRGSRSPFRRRAPEYDAARRR
jgi:hypothetical protein